MSKFRSARVVGVLAATGAIALSMTAGASAHAVENTNAVENTSAAKPTVVLVHGAWAVFRRDGNDALRGQVLASLGQVPVLPVVVQVALSDRRARVPPGDEVVHVRSSSTLAGSVTHLIILDC